MAQKKGQKFGGMHQPPAFSYDPSIEAQRRSQQRGLKDVLKDTHRATRYAGEDLSLKLGDINLAQNRGTQDIAQRLSRGTQDITQTQQRGMEDFGSQLTNLIRGFQIKGNEQMQAQNAAGVLDSSTAQASAARRAENLAIARAPIDTGVQRLTQDTATNLGRLQQDTGTAGQRLGEDTSRNTGLAQQDYGRTTLDLATKKRRAIREQRIGNIDLIQQEIFAARQQKPGAFTTIGPPEEEERTVAVATVSGAKSKKHTATQAVQTDILDLGQAQKGVQQAQRQGRKQISSYKGATRMAIGQIQGQNLGGLRGTPEGRQLAQEYRSRIGDLRSSLPFGLAPLQRDMKSNMLSARSDVASAQLKLQQDQADRAAAAAQIAQTLQQNQAVKRQGAQSAYTEAMRLIHEQALTVQGLKQKQASGGTLTTTEKRILGQSAVPSTELEWMQFEDALNKVAGIDNRSARKAVRHLQSRFNDIAGQATNPLK